MSSRETFMPISKLAFIRSTVLAILIGLVALLLIVGVNLWLVGRARVYSDIVTLARRSVPPSSTCAIRWMMRKPANAATC